MTTPTLTRTPLKERLADIIDCTMQGAWPADDCSACKGRADEKCEACQRQEEDVKVLNTALGHVQNAASEARALAVYLRCFIGLAGLPAEDWSVTIGADGGEQR